MNTATRLKPQPGRIITLFRLQVKPGEFEGRFAKIATMRIPPVISITQIIRQSACSAIEQPRSYFGRLGYCLIHKPGLWYMLIVRWRCRRITLPRPRLCRHLYIMQAGPQRSCTIQHKNPLRAMPLVALGAYPATRIILLTMIIANLLQMRRMPNLRERFF